MRRHGAKATRRSGCDDVPVVDDRSGSGSVLAPGSLLVAAPGLLDPVSSHGAPTTSVFDDSASPWPNTSFSCGLVALMLRKWAQL